MAGATIKSATSNDAARSDTGNMPPGETGKSRRKAGRREKPLLRDESPRTVLAAQLRELRSACGNPTYDELAKLSNVYKTGLIDAARVTRLPPWYVIQGYTEGCWKYYERTFNAPLADAGNLSRWRQLYRDAGGTMQGQSPKEAGERNEQPALHPALAADGIATLHGEAQAQGTAGEVPGLIRARRAQMQGDRGYAMRAVAGIAALPPLIAAAVALAVVLSAATTIIVVENGGTGHHPAARADREIRSPRSARLRVLPLSGHAKMQLEPIQVALTSQLAEVLGWSGATSDRTITGYELRNAGSNSAPVCLGALTTGADAGQKHDPVRAVSCSTRAPNKIWIPVQWDQGHQNLTWLVNDQYPSRCLNVNKALGDGSAAQLWDCYHNLSGPYGLAINEAWDFGDWYANMTSAVNPFPLFLGSSDFCLDTDNQGVGASKGDELPDGTEVDIQNYSDVAPNQYWS
jgi:hypothetical protein